MRELVAMSEAQAAARELAYESVTVDVTASSVLKSASEPYKGSTLLGNALSKHAQRNPHIWGKLSGHSSEWHNLAMKHFDDIMRGPGEFLPVRGDKGIHFLEKVLPDGRGIRLNLNGSFKGLID